MTPPRSATARATTHRSGMSSSLAARPRRSSVSTKSRTGKTRASHSATTVTRHRRRPWIRVASAPRTRRLSFLITSFVIVGVLVVAVASLQAVVSQGSFRMQELARHNLELQQDYGRLKLEVAELSSPGRIATEARRLGLHLPQPEDVRSLTVKRSASVNARAQTASRPALSLKSVLERRP